MKKQTAGRGKQIAAIIGIVLLVALYIMTLVFAICSFPGADKLFMASLVATVFVPILVWVYVYLYGMMTRKKTIATLFPDAPSDEEIIEALTHQTKQEKCTDKNTEREFHDTPSNTSK